MDWFAGLILPLFARKIVSPIVIHSRREHSVSNGLSIQIGKVFRGNGINQNTFETFILII
jgi:hypothetical protein